MRPLRSDGSATVLPALAVFVLLLSLACAQATPASPAEAPPQETPVTSEGPECAQPAPGSEPGFAVPHPADFESALSVDTLAAYRDLPPEFQEALQAYAAWGIAHDLVPVVVDQKIRQWPSSPAPMSEVLTAAGYQDFQELGPRLHLQALYLLYVYPYVLSTEDDPAAQQQALDGMAASMRDRVVWKPESEGGTQEFEDELVELWAPQERIRVSLPPLEQTLLPEAVRRLDSLGPNLRQSFRDMWEEASLAYDVVLPVWTMYKELSLLKAPTGMELPPLEKVLSEEGRQQLRSLSLDRQRYVRNGYADRALSRAGGVAASDPSDTLPLDVLDVCGGHFTVESIASMLSAISRPSS